MQAGLAESDFGDRHPGLGKPSHGVPDQAAHIGRVGRGGKQHGQGEGVGAELDRALQGVGHDRLGLGPLLAVEKPDVQSPRADPGLELGAGPLGHDPALVDHRDLPGQLVGFLQVLGGEQHCGTGRGDQADQLPHLDLAARVHAPAPAVRQERPQQRLRESARYAAAVTVG